MPHSTAGSAPCAARQSAVSSSNTCANLPRDSAAPGPLRTSSACAAVVAQREPQIARAPVAGDEGGGAHGMYMPPLTCTMLPVM